MRGAVTKEREVADEGVVGWGLAKTALFVVVSRGVGRGEVG